MLKCSKFNYHVEDTDGGLLLYNTLSGRFAKVTCESKNTAIEWLTTKDAFPEENAHVKAMKEMGFLIPETMDEDSILHLLYVKSFSGSDLSLTILPTEQCNFRCRYCYEEFKRGKMTKDIQDRIIKYVNKNIHYYSSLNVGWFGGEPLVAMDAIEYLSKNLMDICKRSKRSYISNIVTNGYLLNLENFKKLLSYNVLRYTVTIDGLRETQNFQKPLVNGGETFDTVINNLKSIKQNIKTGTFKITIRTNFTQEIYNQIDDYIQFYYDTFGDDDRFEFFIRPAGDWGGERVKEFSDQFIDGDISQVFNHFIQSDKVLPFNIYSDFLQPMGTVCYAARPNNLLIDSEGSIRKCSCDLDNDEDNKVGEIGINGDLQIDKVKFARWISDFDNYENCTGCFFLPSCLQFNSCPGKKLIHKNKYPICPYERRNIDVTLRLLSKSRGFEILF